MITFVTGKPGDGKSLYGMSLIVDSLLNTDRVIVTNIAVKPKELREYLVLKGWKPKPGADLAERLVVLEHEDVFEFYRFRSGGYVLPPSPDFVQAREGEDEDGKKLKKLSRYQFIRHMTEQMKTMKKNPRALRSCEYHIDEAHDYFSAREWTDTGRGILWYASKHRHLHDEIILYTQVMKNVEAQLRNLASFTVRARNQIRMRWGPFRKAPIFRLYHYYGGPEDTDTCQPFNTGVMQLDGKGLCQTYKTTGALSVHDKPEKIVNKAPLPYWALPVACGLAILCVVAFLSVLPMMAGKYAGAHIKASAQQAAKTAGLPLHDLTSKPQETGTEGAKPSPAGSLAPAVAQKAPGPNGREALSRSAFQKPYRVVQDDAEELPSADVVGVMTVGGKLFVKVQDYEWATVRMDLGSGLLELGNGVVVRRADVLRPKHKRTTPQTTSARQDRPRQTQPSIAGLVSGAGGED